MNCKPPDIAMVVRSDFPENLGKLVSVLRPADPDEFYGNLTKGFYWECEITSPMRGTDDEDETSSSMGMPGDVMAFADSDLRPIRDQPGQDETLSWCDVPSEVHA